MIGKMKNIKLRQKIRLVTGVGLRLIVVDFCQDLWLPCLAFLKKTSGRQMF